MKLFKLIVILAGLTGVVLWSSTKAEASGCCRYDCHGAYCTMSNSDLPAGEAEVWLSECLNDCDAHGTADPSFCPVIFNCRDL